MPGQTLHLAFDDTDSREGRCTTHLAFKVALELARRGARFVDFPLLIRLNPNIPWKTRGNGALCLRVAVKNTEDVIDYVRKAVQESSAIGKGANPGVVFCEQETVPAAARDFSSAAMHDVLSRQMAEKVARSSGMRFFGFGNGQGLVGALAALGCLLDGDHTFELIAYRRAENCGSPRIIDKGRVMRLDADTRGETFCNYDAKNDRVMIGSHGPDPVFVGIRGENPDAVLRAFEILRPEERLDGWTIFRTNQGTNMHLQRELDLSCAKAYTSGFVRCVVASKPVMMEGGHLFFNVAQRGVEMTAAVYEPTGLAKTASMLEPGDEIEIGCGIRKGTTKHPKVLNVEYLYVAKVADTFATANPACPKCITKRMKSDGANKGFKCIRCGHHDRSAAKVQVVLQRSLKPGLHLPAIKAHRHLSKPLQRYGSEKVRQDFDLPATEGELLHLCTSACILG